MSGGATAPSGATGRARPGDLARIERGLDAAAEVLRPYTPGEVAYRAKTGRGDPVTEADHAVDRVLRELLPEPGDGWLSEETVDDLDRLGRVRVWVVDPIDGTREFVDGVPEWCVSIGLVENGRPVAGGILNPATGERIVGGVGLGVTDGGRSVTVREPDAIADATVLASRSETGRGEWTRYADAPFGVRPCGSVAYKLGLVAAGRATATWTLRPKNEWDVAAGAALVVAAGGAVALPDGTEPRFNRPSPELPGFMAGPTGFIQTILQRWLNE